MSNVRIGLIASSLFLGTVLGVSSTKRSVAFSATSSKPSDCEEVACKGTVDSFKESFGKIGTSKHPRVNEAAPNRETLGRAGWTVLHSFAAYYPDAPTDKEKALARSFLEGFAHFYPCKDCAEGLRLVMEEDPPKVESRKDFSIWMCQTHNKVNEQLGKPLQECSLAKLDLRWRGRSLSHE